MTNTQEYRFCKPQLSHVENTFNYLTHFFSRETIIQSCLNDRVHIQADRHPVIYTFVHLSRLKAGFVAIFLPKKQKCISSKIKNNDQETLPAYLADPFLFAVQQT